MIIHRFLFIFFIVPLIWFQQGFCEDSAVNEEITVDLREPIYADGILTTEKGGVVTGPQIRIQALNIRYKKKDADGNLISQIEASDELLIEFGEYLFTGQQLIYDFKTKTGMIFQGRTAVEPWFFGGDSLELRSDGSYLITNGYVTTSEKDVPDWGIFASTILLEEDQYLQAQEAKLKIFNYSLLWIPNFKTNLATIFDNPIRYRFKWGGRQGPRFGLTYEVFSWKRWQTFLRFDYRITRGPGGGLETYYLSEDHKTRFQSINYVSKDSSLYHLHEKIRYRFEGSFHTSFNQKTDFMFSYDKLSDIDMPESYDDRDFSFETSKRTQLLIRHAEENWISNFYARVRVNSFQTVKEELPTFSTNFRPIAFEKSGIIFQNQASASYLDYKYSDNLVHIPDYCSTRFEYQPLLYRPILMGPITCTPEIGGVAIVYGNSPHKESEWVTLGIVGCDLTTQLHRYYDNRKHLLEPYAQYRYYTSPTSSPNQHYIFDINDGWTRLNELTFGIKNSIYDKDEEGNVKKVFYNNLYAHTFFDMDTFKFNIPRLYTNVIFSTLPTIQHFIDAAWDFEHAQVDHFNIRTEWTLNSDFAISAEYRHRSSWCWRKVDPDNFFLELYRNENQLHHSTVSDRRDTVLFHFFYRFRPDWAVEVSSRQGWRRKHEPSYTEFEINLYTTIQTAWNLQLSYQHQETEDRVAIYMNVGLKKPR